MNYDEMNIDCLNRSSPLKPIKIEAEGYICYYCANKIKIKEKYCNVCGMEIDWGNIDEKNILKEETKEAIRLAQIKQTVFRQTKEEFEQLKNDAYEHKMNISDYLRYLVAKERKEREE